MDSRVLQTQEWLNKTYGDVAGFPVVDEDGITGQATFKALIYALQIEIGISNPDGIFGNDTLSKCPTLRESLIPDSEGFIMVQRNFAQRFYRNFRSFYCKCHL